MPDRKSKEPDPKEHDPRAVNPLYRGARLSEVARAVASPTDPEVLERLRRRAEKPDSGPSQTPPPAPGA